MAITIPESIPMENLLSLKGRCAVVTGGSRGIGEAIVRRLVEAGANVVFTGRGIEALQKLEAQIKAMKGTAIGVQADVSRIEDSRKVIDFALERFGKIDILVNNAAVFPGSQAMDMTESIWDETFDTDVKGAFFVSKFAAEAMIHAGQGGRIINLLSTAAFRIASPLIAYGAAKASLWYITQAMAQELAEHRILVNAVTPGATMTAERIAALNTGTLVENTLGTQAAESMKKIQSVLMNNDFTKLLSKMAPLGRPGYPDDLAKAVLFLASDMAGYIGGINITVDGGQSLKTMDIEDNSDGPGATDQAQGGGVLDKSLEGTYKASMKTPMGVQEVVFVYHVNGDALTGTITAAGNTIEIENGRAIGDGFAYQYKMKGPIGKITVKVVGKLEGDKISGTIKTPLGSLAFEGNRV